MQRDALLILMVKTTQFLPFRVGFGDYVGISQCLVGICVKRTLLQLSFGLVWWLNVYATANETHYRKKIRP